jgi:chromosome segregation ATPase
MTASDTSGTASGGSNDRSSSGTQEASDPDAIREEIERTRDDLAETVDALHAKLDVKGQARAKVNQVKSQATTASGKPRPELVAGAAGAVLLIAGLIWWRKQ